MEFIVSAISTLALGLGCFFMLTGGIGLLRFPDFLSRMHAAGVTDTLASFLIIVGLMLQVGWGMALFKLALILLFVFFTSPVSSHALAKAAMLDRSTADSTEGSLPPLAEVPEEAALDRQAASTTPVHKVGADVSGV